MPNAYVLGQGVGEGGSKKTPKPAYVIHGCSPKKIITETIWRQCTYHLVLCAKQLCITKFDCIQFITSLNILKRMEALEKDGSIWIPPCMNTYKYLRFLYIINTNMSLVLDF